MDEWGDEDDEFEKSMIDFELSPDKTAQGVTTFPTILKPTDECSDTPLLTESQGPTCSTPIRTLNKTPSTTITTPENPTINLFKKPDEPVKRKFPGPAGKLPKLKKSVDLSRLKHQYVEQNCEKNKLEIVAACSQPSQTSHVLASSSWNNLINDLDLDQEHLAKHNIETATQTALKGLLPEGKVPLLVVLMESVDKTLPDAIVQLRDHTGTMTGVVHRLLVKQYQNEIVSGASLLLHRTSVFRPCPRKYYLNITPNNLLRVYPEARTSYVSSHIQVSAAEPELRDMLDQPITRSPSPPALTITPSRGSLFSTPGCPTGSPFHNSTNTNQTRGVAAKQTSGPKLTNTLKRLDNLSSFATTPPAPPVEICGTIHQRREGVPGGVTGYGTGKRSEKSVDIAATPSRNPASDIFDDDDLSDLDLSLVM